MSDRSPYSGFGVDRRAVTPVVGKAMEVAIVVLYIGVVTTGIYTGIAPEYRDTAGDRIADRTVAAAGEEIERAVPPDIRRVEQRVSVDLPETIRGDRYRIHVDDATLVLEHPRDRIGSRLQLSLPSRVESVSGSWSSEAPAVVAVSGSSDGVTIRLVNG